MDTQTPAPLDRLNALFSWWGFSTSGEKGGFPPLAAASDLVAKLQHAYFDAMARNIDTAFAASNEVSRAAQALLHVKAAEDIARIQQGIVQILADVTTAQSKSWNEFQQQLLALAANIAPESATAGKPAAAAATAATADIPVKALVRERAAPKARAQSAEQELAIAASPERA